MDSQGLAPTRILHEITNQQVYDDRCHGQTVCIISFIPNIYDSSTVERNNYLTTLSEVYRKHFDEPFTFFWLQAGDQLDLERKLNLGFGFPAIIAVSPRKHKIAYMKSSFDGVSIDLFLKDLLIGKSSLEGLHVGMKFQKSKAWDGKDAPIIEEYYDIDDDEQIEE